MKIWAVSMVKDEADIIEYTIAHLDSQGLDGIIVADNMSVDGTYELLSHLDPFTQFILKRDEDLAYYQSQKMTALARQAFRLGADWVIPFDADELWYSPFGSLREAIEHVADRQPDCFLATLHNYFPTRNDPHDEPNPYLRLSMRDPVPAPLAKVIVRRNEHVIIAQGNHDITGISGPIRRQSPIMIAHCPWRSAEQYIHKIRNGAKAYAATDLPDDAGAHWRQHGQILDTEGTEALRTVFEAYFYEPAINLEHVPIPWRH